MYHLYEVVFESRSMWLKVQAPGDPVRQDPALPMLEARFGGATIDDRARSFAVPFHLSERHEEIHNWEDVKGRLPAGWDNDEFRLAEGPYPWCETLSDDCDCQAMKGRRDATYCADLGLTDEADRRAARSQNAWHLSYIRGLERAVANRDEVRRQEKARRAPGNAVQGMPVAAATGGVQMVSGSELEQLLSDFVNRVNQLVARRFYCQVEGRYHPCSEQTKQKLIVDAVATVGSVARMDERVRRVITGSMDGILDHWLRLHQSKECAEKVVRGDPGIPDVLYKYVPRDLIGQGVPNSLRVTQLRALNDDMECSVTTMNGSNDVDSLSFLALVQSRLGEHLGIIASWEELLTRSVRYADLRLSTFIQDYLSPLVGVVSFSTDPLVPTMWAHYAHNTGIVVGYDTDTLRSMGFVLRPMLYSEMAPTYEPTRDDVIRLRFADRERLEEQARLGETPDSLKVVADADLAEMGGGWKLLCPLLFVKGTSWGYEKEVRLLVDLEQARDTGKVHEGWPIKVIDPPPQAIREIYRGENTRDDDVGRAVELARGEDKKGLLVQRVSAHAFKIQRTVGSRY